ncbi:hypothetical protein [Aliarcobacter butzleri]|uniref:hypothetical protein n=1 Tax=Aliarcobacter butzleri TaxID=28197 RepID=UPI002B2499D3|nr:hypothetical protein [Aliarcobacter butzleri]
MNISGNIIKNPLTIIAIFAGIVEIGSNTVLPFLSVDNQSKYIWFLMLFPFLLVLIFFYILYNKHHVLYAPSDFNDEKNFSDLIFNSRKSTAIEVDKKMENEIQILNEEAKKLEQGKESSNMDLNSKHDKFSNLIKNNRKILSSLETKLLDKFSLVYNCSIQKNITLETIEGKLITDGFIKNGKNINIIEVKILSRFIVFRHLIKMFIERKLNILEKISEEYNLTLSFIILSPDDGLKGRFKRFEDSLNEKYKNLSIKIYPFIIDEIIDEEIKYLEVLSNTNDSINF